MANRKADVCPNEKRSQDCCRFMTRGEKVLLFFLAVTLLVLLGLFIFIVSLLLKDNVKCNTPACVKLSADLLDTMDLTSDPCSDFHSFVCGTTPPAPEDSGNQISQRMLSLITDPPSLEADSRLVLTVKEFFQTCSGSERNQKVNDYAILTLLKRMGGWPLILGQNWDEGQFHWLTFMGRMRDLGVKSDWLVELGSFVDEDGTNLLKISPPPYLKQFPSGLKKLYYQSMVDIAVEMGSSRKIAESELEKVVAFEDSLRTVGKAALNSLGVHNLFGFQVSERLRNKSSEFNRGNYIVVTVEELNDFWPKVNLGGILNVVAQGYTVFTNRTSLVLEIDAYITELNFLLNGTPKRTQANFMFWKALESFLPYATDKYKQLYEGYFERIQPEDFCVSETLKIFYGALESEYERLYFSNETRSALGQMVNLIKADVTEESLASSDTELRIVDPGFFGEHYGITDFEFHSENIINMIREAQIQVDNDFFKCINRRQSRCPRKASYENLDDMELLHFDVDENTIYLPSDLLESNWYDLERPQFFNYARLGRRLGDLILEATYNASLEGAEKLTGVDLAYLGYVRLREKRGLERELVALNFTANQLFWIEAASNYCHLDRNSSKFEEIRNSTHFTKQFGC